MALKKGNRINDFPFGASLVELEGFEPSSSQSIKKLSTCLATCWIVELQEGQATHHLKPYFQNLTTRVEKVRFASLKSYDVRKDVYQTSIRRHKGLLNT